MELRIRRLKWFKALTQDRATNAQVIDAVFGSMRVEKRRAPLDEWGYATRYANPWLRQFQDDVLALRA